MFFLIFVSNFFYLILDSIPFFPPFFLFFSFFSFSFFSFFFSFLDTKYNPTSTPPEPGNSYYKSESRISTDFRFILHFVGTVHTHITMSEEILGFIAEWFDEGPQLTKRFLVKVFMDSNEIEVRLTLFTLIP